MAAGRGTDAGCLKLGEGLFMQPHLGPQTLGAYWVLSLGPGLSLNLNFFFFVVAFWRHSD